MKDLLIELFKIDSPAGNEGPVRNYLKEYFAKLGYKLAEDSCGNLYLSIGSGSPIAFLAHMDTVSSTKGLELIVTDTHIRSGGNTILGADDKAGIALLCELVRNLPKDHCPIEIIFTVSEEIGLLGAKGLDYNRIHSRIAFVLDAGGPVGTIVTKAPSLERINIVVKGKSAHAGAEPEKGVNAIAIAAKAISNIKQGRINSETTLNIGKIYGGEATNIVPEKVIVEGEARSFDIEALNKEIKEVEEKFYLAAKEFGGSIEFNHILSFSTFNLDKESPPVKLAVNAAKRLGIRYNITHSGGGSDANILNSHGIESVGLGIGVFDAHTSRENISLNDLYKSLDWLIEITRRQLDV